MIRCVVAEDFQELNDIYTNFLKHENDIVVEGSARNSQELFTILAKKEVDVILMDIEMESQDAGINNCKRVCQEYPKIKVLMLTCHEEDAKIMAAFEAGAVDYILKTSSLSEIITGVKNAYNDEAPIHPHAASVLRKNIRGMEELKNRLYGLTKSIYSLTNTEIGILGLLMEGKKQREIAAQRNIELVTVKSHVTNILRKFKVRRTSEILKQIDNSGLEDLITDLAQSSTRE